ncbi:hypothetical protein D805_1084 [Bifidobacterium thermophilum RBL67]|uniref:Uncharacterized protein n=1 Tax=Bifidobacterium thermophilum RBL67 TaxID=1254439 RepID=M4RCW3_9BIFI|nr:hypothetical protein D805_1084 [Bifidobacterium thermophilum RBL67]
MSGNDHDMSFLSEAHKLFYHSPTVDAYDHVMASLYLYRRWEWGT